MGGTQQHITGALARVFVLEQDDFAVDDLPNMFKMARVHVEGVWHHTLQSNMICVQG